MIETRSSTYIGTSKFFKSIGSRPNCAAIKQLSSGRLVACYRFDGIYISDDEGKTWIKVSNNGATRFLVTSTGRILAISSTKVYYSDNDGETWTSKDLPFPTVYAWNGVCCITANGKIIIAGDSYNIFAVSNDNGATFDTILFTSGANSAGAVLGTPRALFVTSTGRILMSPYTDNDDGIWYSDDEGETWRESNYHSLYGGMSVCPYAIIETSTGRLISYINNSKVSYSDNDGATWAFLDIRLTNNTRDILTAYTGRVLTLDSSNIVYSDDNGNTWVHTLNSVPSDAAFKLVTRTGRLIVSNSQGIFYSDPIKYEHEKYLDQNGAQEIVTQFKAYCNSLVGGA